MAGNLGAGNSKKRLYAVAETFSAAVEIKNI